MAFYEMQRAKLFSREHAHSTFKLNWIRIWPIVPFSKEDALPSQPHPAFASNHNPDGGMTTTRDAAWLHKSLCALQGAPSASSV